MERGIRPVTMAVAVLVLLVAGCGGDGGGAESTTTLPPPTSTAATTTTEPGSSTTTTVPGTTTSTVPATTTTVVESNPIAVYFLLDPLPGEDDGPYLVPVHRTWPGEVTPDAVIETLLAGPSSDEASGTPRILTEVPAGTQLLGVDVAGGVATVDLSGTFDDGGGSASMFARLAQVVFTLTRLPDVDAVAFALDGEPVGTFSSEGIVLDGAQVREDYYEWLPLVFVDSPAWGEPVTSPFTVSGLSNAFEAVSQVLVTDDDGAPLFESTVTATCGTGCWGEWQVDVTYDLDRPQLGAVIVWMDSPQDGGRVAVREYPVQLD
jgi:spore germination protein GerM